MTAPVHAAMTLLRSVTCLPFLFDDGEGTMGVGGRISSEMAFARADMGGDERGDGSSRGGELDSPGAGRAEGDEEVVERTGRPLFRLSPPRLTTTTGQDGQGHDDDDTASYYHVQLTRHHPATSDSHRKNDHCRVDLAHSRRGRSTSRAAFRGEQGRGKRGSGSSRTVRRLADNQDVGA
jgi:hypothetical protein